jgi:hypothetical protein
LKIKSLINSIRTFGTKMMNLKYDKYKRSQSWTDVILEGILKIKKESLPGRWLIEYSAKYQLEQKNKSLIKAPYIALETILKGYIVDMKKGIEIEIENASKLMCDKISKNFLSIYLMIEDKNKKISLYCNVISNPTFIKNVSIFGFLKYF